MSAATITATGGTGTAVPSPSLARLTGVELRKMTDTRASRWLLGIVLLAGVGMILVQMFSGDAADRNLSEFFGIAQMGAGLLLPIVGILAITGEWSQRTALATFTLEPRRGHVVAAKLAAGVALVVVTVAATLALAAVANLAAPAVTDAAGEWTLGADEPARAVLYQLTGYLVGAAFGLALLNTPLAIVAFFALPTVWSIVGGVVSSLQDVAAWLDLEATTTPIIDGSLDGEAWAQLAASMGVWCLLPLLVGVARVVRTELT
ncbi:hypothetical protein CLV30_11988 [Haloactinopolyspora alba]|uniref:ABC-2 family transporter n=1 Tax=Haloactinopolyspora alba TaxID=648780 RepID=A0A2P8DNB7_9ACTN|nr:ABC transporter permease [Haloactinopolyspora alba]PSK98705.1 hypothetical protein CLV30_11988 [Haloactinopolyspora alba]